MSTEDCRK